MEVASLQAFQDNPGRVWAYYHPKRDQYVEYTAPWTSGVNMLTAIIQMHRSKTERRSLRPRIPVSPLRSQSDLPQPPAERQAATVRHAEL